MSPINVAIIDQMRHLKSSQSHDNNLLGIAFKVKLSSPLPVLEETVPYCETSSQVLFLKDGFEGPNSVIGIVRSMMQRI